MKRKHAKILSMKWRKRIIDKQVSFICNLSDVCRSSEWCGGCVFNLQPCSWAPQIFPTMCNSAWQLFFVATQTSMILAHAVSGSWELRMQVYVASRCCIKLAASPSLALSFSRLAFGNKNATSPFAPAAPSFTPTIITEGDFLRSKIKH